MNSGLSHNLVLLSNDILFRELVVNGHHNIRNRSFGDGKESRNIFLVRKVQSFYGQ